jgi:hypothetical protein
MTSTHHVSPLPPPPPPARAAQALAEIAYAAAGAWAQPLDPSRHGRAVSQLNSALRDTGIAARGLAAWQSDGDWAGTTPAEFARHMTAAADWLLTAWNWLEGATAAEVAGLLPEPDEPGAALCHTARVAIRAWRQPSGAAADRDATVRRFITAAGFLSAAALGLATYAPPCRVADLQAVCASLAEVTADLAAAVQEADSGSAPGSTARDPKRAGGQAGPE